jgi:hypothetical protein
MMSAAAQRDDRCFAAPNTVKGATLSKASARLIRLGFVREMECAPAGGQIERLDLTMPVGLPEDGSHDEASIAQRGIQAAGC